MKHLSAAWNYPTSILVGAGAAGNLAQHCFEKGMRKPLLVTDPGLASLPLMEKIETQCREAGLGLGVFCQVKGNPNGENVEQGVKAFHAAEHDGVIALGGGSALDAAKAIALMVGQDRPLWDFEDEGDNWLRVREEGMADVIAIPTTAGTGSEVGRASVITNEEEHRKVIIFHPKMLPSLVLLDPELSTGLPGGLTAATGMDALSHSLEAYCSNAYHPMAEGIALESMRLIKDHLPEAFKNGSNLEARQQMLVASCMGATAFQRGLGAMHALAHSLGALYDAHHGTLNAVLMPYVLLANQAKIAPRLARAARYLGLEQENFNGFLDWVLELRRALGIPHSLKDLNINHEQGERVAQMSVADPSAGGNPIAFTQAQYQKLFEAAVAGDLNAAAQIV